MNDRIAIWGDGAVGTGLAVALSSHFDTVLLGPPGSGRGQALVTASGFIQGSTHVLKAESGDEITADNCIVAVKAYHIPNIVEDLSSSFDSCISVVNGMGLSPLWGDMADGVEYAVLTAGFNLKEPGRVECSDGAVTVQRGAAAESIFQDCSIPVETTGDMETVRWSKWLVNSVINPLGAVSRLRNDMLLQAGLDCSIEALFDELVKGVPAGCRESAAERARHTLDELLRGSANCSSMLQDVLAGRRTEIDFLTGLLPSLSNEEAPLTNFLTALVRALS